MEPAARLQRRFPQVLAVAHVIGVPEEARLPVIAPLDDMLRDAHQIEPLLSWHEGPPLGRANCCPGAWAKSVGLPQKSRAENVL